MRRYEMRIEEFDGNVRIFDTTNKFWVEDQCLDLILEIKELYSMKKMGDCYKYYESLDRCPYQLQQDLSTLTGY